MMIINVPLTNHPDTGDPKDLPLVAKIDARADSVCIRVETEGEDGICELYIERRDGAIVLHAWDESCVDDDPSHSAIMLVESVRGAIENVRNRRVGRRSPARLRRWDRVDIGNSLSYMVIGLSPVMLAEQHGGRIIGLPAHYDLFDAVCVNRTIPQMWRAGRAMRIEQCRACNDWIIVADDHEPGTLATCNCCKANGPGKDGSL